MPAETTSNRPRPEDVRAARGDATRDLLLDTAERLFAERGVQAVSNRMIGVEAGQRNNAVVGYHFNTKHDLVRAIVRRHGDAIDRARTTMVDHARGSTDLRTWVGCMVRPVTGHLNELRPPSWYARFGAQVMTEPTYRDVIVDEALGAESLQQTLDGMYECLPGLTPAVRAERSAMARILLAHVCAERERDLNEDTATPRATWDDCATGLIDAIVGIWSAPVSHI